MSTTVKVGQVWKGNGGDEYTVKSYDPDRKQWVFSMSGGGTLRTSDPTRSGLVLPQVVRVQPGQVWEGKNSGIRFQILNWDEKHSQWWIRYDSDQTQHLHSEELITDFCKLVDTPVTAPSKEYPHACTSCGSRAYIGLKDVSCSNAQCHHYA